MEIGDRVIINSPASRLHGMTGTLDHFTSANDPMVLLDDDSSPTWFLPSEVEKEEMCVST